MKQDILNALCGDESKYNFIMQRTRQRDIVKLRWEVWYSLHSQKYSANSIAKFFNMSHATVLHGLNKINNQVELSEIQNKIIRFR